MAYLDASSFRAPEVKALLVTLADREVECFRAAEEFRIDAGPERAALVGERAQAVRIIKGQKMAVKSGRGLSSKPRERK